MPFVSTNELNSFTERNIRKTAVDQQYNSAAILAIMKAKNRIVIESGGSIITQPILVQKNTTAISYNGADVLPASAQEEFSSYELPYKQATASVTITGLDELRNRGKHEQLSLVKNKQETALMALFDLLAGFVFADGTGNAGKDWDGFLGAINNAAGFQVYLGIDRLANTFWQGQVFDPGTPTALSAANMMTLFMQTRIDTEVIDVISATNAGYQQYWNLLTPGERYVDDTLANIGFDNIAFQGKPLVVDSHNPAGSMFFWNLDHCRLVIHRDRNFKFNGFKEPDSQDIMIGRWLVAGNMECRKPKANGVYRSILNG